MKTRVIVTRRGHDYHACFEDESVMWGCAPTAERAVDDLVRAWRDRCAGGVEIVLDYVPRALRDREGARP